MTDVVSKSNKQQRKLKTIETTEKHMVQIF